MKRIETTFLLVCVAILLVLGAVMLWQEYTAGRADIEHLVKEQAALALEFDLAIRRYVADHIRPEVEKRVAEGVFIPEAMSTSYVARRVFEDVRERFPAYILKFSSDNPRNPANAASPDEVRVLEYFRDHPDEKEYVGRVTLDGKPYLAHFRPRRMEEACLRCHGKPEDAPASLLAEYGREAGFGREVGQVIAMDTVAMPAEGVEATVVAHVWRHLAVGALAIVLLFAAIVVAFRYIVTQRLGRITERARAIADGDAGTLPEPVEVSGRDEITTLAEAFNRMTGRLLAQRREIADHSETLERRVAERTDALEQANENLRQEVRARRRIEVHLRDSEERLGQIISFLPDPTFVVDRNGTVIAWNRAMEALTGHPADEMVGRGDYAHGEAVYGRRRPMLVDVALGHADAEALYEGLERDGDTVTAEVELPRDGNDVALWCTARPLRDSRGEVVGAVESARDVTDQRRARDALRHSENEKRAILDATPEFVVLFDTEQRIVWANASAAEAAGLAREDLVGRRCWEFWGDGVRSCPGCSVAKALETGSTHEHEQTMPDGREWFVRGTPLFGPDGEIAGAVEMARDITGRKRREEALRASEARYRLLAENQRDVVVALTPDGAMTYCSPAMEEFGGYTAEEVVGTSAADYLAADADRRAVFDTIGRIVAARDAATAEFLFVPKDGDPFPAEATGKPVIEDGEVVSVQAVLRDVSERKRAEERLAIFRRFAEASEQGFGMADMDGRATYVNPALLRMLGLDRENELVGKPFVPFYPEEVQERLRNEILPAVRRGEPWQGELWFVDRHGRRVETYESYFLIHDDHGNPLCLADVLTDITDRKRDQERFHVLFEGSRDALMTLAPPSWRFTSGNPAALALFGAEDEEAFKALGPWDISPETQPDGRPSGEKAREMIETAVREGSHFFEWTHRRLGGEPFPATVLLTRMEVGGDTVVQATVRDVTARKRAEEALCEEREKLAKIAGSAQDAIVMMDADGNVSFWNRAAETIFGYTADEALGEELHRLMAPERFHEAFRKGFAHFQQSGEGPAVGRTLDLVARRKTGNEFPAELSLSAVRLRGAWHAIGIVRDVTERKRAEEALAAKARELARSNTELQEFAYVASHDLQEPLRMVSSYVQLLARRYEDCLDDDAQEFIGYAVDGAQRMQTLINDLLQYSRVGTKGKPFAPTDGDEVMEDVLANLEVAVKEAGAEVTHDPLPTVVADEGQLIRVFQNLIGNALKFCDGAPRIHVSAEKGGGEWRFSVRDNGIGIDPDQQDDVFAVFHRLHGRDKYAGTGMGLAITKRIVERHGGRIWVESRPGEGSTFHFTIPERKDPTDEHEHDDGDEAVRAVACPAGGDSAG